MALHVSKFSECPWSVKYMFLPQMAPVNLEGHERKILSLVWLCTSIHNANSVLQIQLQTPTLECYTQ